MSTVTLDRYALHTENTRLLIKHNAGCDGKSCQVWFEVEEGIVMLSAFCPVGCGVVPIMALQNGDDDLLTLGPLAATSEKA